MSCFLNLPTELACEIVGKWLCLKDLVRLDSTFCHKEMRNVLHESVFQCPRCIVAIPAPSYLLMPVIFTWVSMKCIRLSTLHVRHGAPFDNCEDYLKGFGGTVHSVVLSYCSGKYATPLTLVARYCTNIRLLAVFYCDLRLCVDFLKSLARLRSIEIKSITCSTDLDTINSETHRLSIASIKLQCSSLDEEVILGMCDPLCVQRLQLTNMTHTDWHTYVHLRSFGFYYDYSVHDANLLVQICTLCPWIVNLEVYSSGWLSDEIVVPAIAALKQLRTFHCEYLDNLTDNVVNTLIAHHKHTLEAVYVYGCDSMSTSAQSRLLKECLKLHTMSCEAQDDIDYSLMSNLTTLIMNFPSATVWNKVQQHCHSLRHLHFAQMLATQVECTQINVDAGNLQALRTVYTTRAYVTSMRVQFPSICVVEEEDGGWYDLFDIPI